MTTTMNCIHCGAPLPEPMELFRDTVEPICQDCYVGGDEDLFDETFAAGLALLEVLGEQETLR